MLRFVARGGDCLRVHDRAARWAMADRRIATAMIHVLAERAGRSRGHFFTAGFALGREWSAMRKVARATGTTAWQRGHFGSIVLPAAPSR